MPFARLGTRREPNLAKGMGQGGAPGKCTGGQRRGPSGVQHCQLLRTESAFRELVRLPVHYVPVLAIAVALDVSAGNSELSQLSLIALALALRRIIRPG